MQSLYKVYHQQQRELLLHLTYYNQLQYQLMTNPCSERQQPTRPHRAAAAAAAAVAPKAIGEPPAPPQQPQQQHGRAKRYMQRDPVWVTARQVGSAHPFPTDTKVEMQPCAGGEASRGQHQRQRQKQQQPDWGDLGPTWAVPDPPDLTTAAMTTWHTSSQRGQRGLHQLGVHEPEQQQQQQQQQMTLDPGNSRRRHGGVAGDGGKPAFIGPTSSSGGSGATIAADGPGATIVSKTDGQWHSTGAATGAPAPAPAAGNAHGVRPGRGSSPRFGSLPAGHIIGEVATEAVVAKPAPLPVPAPAPAPVPIPASPPASPPRRSLRRSNRRCKKDPAGTQAERKLGEKQRSIRGISCSVDAAGGAAQDATKDRWQVLFAKALTASDTRTRRVIVPRSVLESSFPQAAKQSRFSFFFNATDAAGVCWHFAIGSWKNEKCQRPVYVMERMFGFMKRYDITTGDVIGVLRAPDGTMHVEVNTSPVIAAAAPPFTRRAKPSADALRLAQPCHPQQYQQHEEEEEGQEGQEGDAVDVDELQGTDGGGGVRGAKKRKRGSSYGFAADPSMGGSLRGDSLRGDGEEGRGGSGLGRALAETAAAAAAAAAGAPLPEQDDGDDDAGVHKPEGLLLREREQRIGKLRGHGRTGLGAAAATIAAEGQQLLSTSAGRRVMPQSAVTANPCEKGGDSDGGCKAAAVQVTAAEAAQDLDVDEMDIIAHPITNGKAAAFPRLRPAGARPYRRRSACNTPANRHKHNNMR
ncbi:hypothetical protein Vafri_15133 [Volvox africanus]|nr:hypothetical protein Vafri_15133 [Volvox africanus]